MGTGSGYIMVPAGHLRYSAVARHYVARERAESFNILAITGHRHRLFLLGVVFTSSHNGTQLGDANPKVVIYPAKSTCLCNSEVLILAERLT